MLPLDIIIPLEIDHQHRMENILVVVQYILDVIKPTKVIIVETGERPRGIMALPDDPRIMKCFIGTTDKKWSKSKPYNTGLMWATSPVVSMWDADITIPPEVAQGACRGIIEEDVDYVVPYSHTVYLWRKVALEYVREQKVPYEKLVGHEGVTNCFENTAGGCSFAKLSTMRHVRGMNELFWGWGFEDDEILMRLSKLGFKCIRIRGPLLHINHHRTPNCLPDDETKDASLYERCSMVDRDQASILEYMGITPVPGRYSALTEPEVLDVEAMGRYRDAYEAKRLDSAVGE